MSIHPTAIIHPKAELDPTVEVGPYCVIDEHVRVAGGCRLFPHVYLTGWTEIGERCVLHPGVVVGHEPQDVKYSGVQSYCRIGRRTVLREYVTIHRGTHEDSATTVGDDCFLLGAAHVAHNCVVGDRVTLINGVLLAGHVEVGNGVTIGGAAGVHQFVRIGSLAMIAGNSRVSMDVVPYALSDVQGRVAGLNRVGLRRAGISGGSFETLRGAYRLLFASGLPFRTAVTRLEEDIQSRPILPVLLSSAASSSAPLEPVFDPRMTVLHFLQAASRRGIAGRSRRREND